METTKENKNVKMPSYAVKLAKGMFAGANWQCIKCGYRASGYSSMPSPTCGGRCPDTSSGNHIWQQC